MKKVIILIILTFAFDLINSQNIIYLSNSSFEDLPHHSKTPTGWYDCGFTNESPVSIHKGGHDEPFFRVTLQPSDGKTYMGMVARDNGTWESISQRLIQPMVKGKNYHFELDLSRSFYLESIRRETGFFETYKSPLRFQIWGGNSYCDNAELLAKSDLIRNTNWFTYDFVFKPTKTFKYIIFECFYESAEKVYNGNILVDNCSPIIEVSNEFANNFLAETPVLQDFEKDHIEATIERSKGKIRKKIETKEVIKKPVEPEPYFSYYWDDDQEMMDSLQSFQNTFSINKKEKELSGSTKIKLIYVLGNIERSKKYQSFAIGVLGNKRERALFAEPFLNFLEEYNLSGYRLKILKRKEEELREDWILTEGDYWFKLIEY